MTLNHLIWILGPFFQTGLAYVALSRLRQKEGILIIEYENYKKLTIENMNKGKHYINIHKEYDNLLKTQRIELRRIANSEEEKIFFNEEIINIYENLYR